MDCAEALRFNICESRHVPLSDSLAARLRGIDLVQSCFQTLDGPFAHRNAQREAAAGTVVVAGDAERPQWPPKTGHWPA